MVKTDQTLRTKPETLPEGYYSLMEAFYTIQGEGAHQGKAAYFIRLGGCDVGCHWCDVKDSWDLERWPAVDTAEIVGKAASFPARMAVVTGGEPLMHDLQSITTSLKANGFSIHLETSGAYPLSGTLDWICLSPKKFKAPLTEVAAKANELKVVVYNQSDFVWAEEHAAAVDQNCLLYLQPEWSRQEQMLPRIIDYVKATPRWRISLQVHKFMQIP